MCISIRESFNKIKNAIDEDKRCGYGGIDIALDSTDYCVGSQENKNKLVKKIRRFYPNSKYIIDELNENNKNYCRHHISITF
jgi:hypothetical protein